MFAQPEIGHPVRNIVEGTRLCDRWWVIDWVVDLDGVMWRGEESIPGSVEAVGALLERGDRVVFCTNNSTVGGAERTEQLADRGVPAGAQVVTSADAARSLVVPGEQLLVLGSDSLAATLAKAGAEVESAGRLADELDSAGTWADPDGVRSTVGRFDSVIVGLARGVDYRQLDLVCAAVHEGARLLATNTDPTFPARGRLRPGTGAIVAAVEAATGLEAVVAGKPHAPMAEAIRIRLGEWPPGPDPTVGAGPDAQHAMVVVGDRVDTDGCLAARLGCRFALVLSGSTASPPQDPEVPIAAVAADLAALVGGRLQSGSLPGLGDRSAPHDGRL